MPLDYFGGAGTRCFVCNRKITAGEAFAANTNDGQSGVAVGPECAKKVIDAGADGLLLWGNLRVIAKNGAPGIAAARGQA